MPDSLADVECICENLRLGPLFEQLLDEVPRKQRKELSYLGGIRISCLDVGYPCPYSSADDTRDPGDALWAEVFDELVGDTARLLALSDDTKGDFLELTLGAAAVLLDGKMHQLSQPLQRCLHGARLVIEDLARTCGLIRARGTPCYENYRTRHHKSRKLERRRNSETGTRKEATQ